MTIRAERPATRTQSTAGRSDIRVAWIKAIGRALDAVGCDSRLRAPRHGLGELTYLLGFSPASSFTRAIRRWSGQSPSHWRTGAAAS
jgi:AraC-like DNA-binding protein